MKSATPYELRRIYGEEQIIAAAKEILADYVIDSHYMESPQKVKDYLSAHLGMEEAEIFAVVFLNAQNAVITVEKMFHGTLTQTSVYPREVVKKALQLNAAAVILAHNHPSGSEEPSRADEFLTQTLKSALALVDVRVLDHMIVARDKIMSFAERGLL